MTLHLLNPGQPPEAQLFESLLGSLEGCVALVDAAGAIVAMNEAWHGFQGRNPFVAGRAIGSSYPKVCAEILAAGDGNLALVALGANSVLQGEIPRLHFDFPYPEVAELAFYEMVAVNVPHAQGTLSVFSFRDITRRMSMERRLRRSERLFKVTTDHALDLICLLDGEGRISYHNPALQRLLGHSPTWYAEKRYVELVHPDDQEDFIGILQKGSQAGLTPIFEYRIADSQGQWLSLEGQASLVEDPGGQKNTLLFISRDISSRKRAEQERASVEVQLRHSQKMEAVGHLAAGIAHEINTPIQFVGDNLRFLLEGFRSLQKVLMETVEILANAAAIEEARERLEAALEREDVSYLAEEAPKALRQSMDGVERVATIVKAMKMFSHPGTEGRVALDLNQAIDSTLIVSRNEWKYLAEVETDFDPNLPKAVCFPGEFNQVILNLVVNAAQAIGELADRTEMGRITVSTRQDGDWVEIRVQDTGPGISKEQQAKIWLPFYTTKPVGRGTGQGLSIVHSVVEKHGGSIRVESEPGRGATFVLRLPLLPPPMETDP